MFFSIDMIVDIYLHQRCWHFEGSKLARTRAMHPYQGCKPDPAAAPVRLAMAAWQKSAGGLGQEAY